MRIWITRHGQTKLNKKKLMQGRTDEPLNDIGRGQAKRARKNIGEINFDAVYSSPLQRAVETAAIIGNIDPSQVIKDPRITEVDFGIYEKKPYLKLGPKMTFYWVFPEIFSAPSSVEPVSSMVERSGDFLKDLEKKDYENVLIVCHGGIIRALCGHLEERKNKIKWRPKPKNCEIRVYEYEDGKHTFVKSYKND